MYFTWFDCNDRWHSTFIVLRFKISTTKGIIQLFQSIFSLLFDFEILKIDVTSSSCNSCVLYKCFIWSLIKTLSFKMTEHFYFISYFLLNFLLIVFIESVNYLCIMKLAWNGYQMAMPLGMVARCSCKGPFINDVMHLGGGRGCCKICDITLRCRQFQLLNLTIALIL